ncbi:MAG: RtcB family protein [Parcubacteria group bacterium]|jgi:tRNA-splicing ligase RtcB
MSEYVLKKVGEHKRIIEPVGNMKVPVVFPVSDVLMPGTATIEELANVACDPHVFHHVAALSDTHSKKGRKNPTGSAVATRRFFLPQAMDTAPNCGMRLISTPFGENDLDGKAVNKLFEELIKVIPTAVYVGTRVDIDTVVDVCRRGTKAILEKLKIDSSEYEYIFNGGNFFNEIPSEKDILDSIPRTFLRIAQLRLGILGAAGNHFLDLMKVADILDEDVANKLGIKKGQYLFLMHTGSGMLGQYASYFYTPKEKEHRSQKIVLEMGRRGFLKKNNPVHEQLRREIPAWRNKQEFYSIDSESELGRMYMTAHRASANHGFANRSILTEHIRLTVKKVFGKDFELPLIYDMPHVHVQEETHYGEKVLVHRNGASRANGPERMRKLLDGGSAFVNPLHAETGEPIFIPSSMATPFYFGVGTDENDATFFSASHGTGKAKEKQGVVPKNREELMEKMKKSKVKLFNAKSRQIIDQDSSHYKDVEEVIAGMTENKIIKVVAKMDPIAVLMA